MKKTKILGIIAMTFVLAQASIGFAEAPALLVDGEKIDAESGYVRGFIRRI